MSVIFPLLLIPLLAAAPADDEMAWIMSHAATLPATTPTTAPATTPTSAPASSPFIDKPLPGSRKGTITLSDGRTFTGQIRTTLDKPIRLFDPDTEQFRDIPWNLIRSMEAKILWERDEKEWHFKDSGSDIKEYTGKTYPARELAYTLTLVNGQTISGSVAAPLHMQTPDDEKNFPLHKRDKGDVGQRLKDLVYVLQVELE